MKQLITRCGNQCGQARRLSAAEVGQHKLNFWKERAMPQHRIKVHNGKKIMLACAVLASHIPVGSLSGTTVSAALPQILGTAEITGSCPANCKLVQSINNIITAEDSNGVRVSFSWTTAQLPAGMNMVGFTVSAKLVLKDNKAVESGEQSVGANASSATVLVRGKFLNRNINRSDVKAGSAIVKANAITTSNPTVNVTSKEIVGNDGAEVNMLVKWTAPSVASPCLAERTVSINASAQNAGGIKFEGGTAAKLTANSATVRLRGLGLRRKEMKNLQASVQMAGVALSCGLAKSIQSFSGAGGNP